MITGSLCRGVSRNISGDFNAISPALGRIYYVNPDGDDSAPGTRSDPWKTPTKAATDRLPGDIVIFMDGTYTDTQYGADEVILPIRYGGVFGKPVIFMAENPGQAILDGRSGTTKYGILQYGTASHVVIDGFVIKDCWHFGISFYASYGTVKACIIRNIGNTASSSDPTGKGGIFTYQNTEYFLIVGNDIYECGRLTLTAGDDHWNEDHGIYCCSENSKIINNKIHGNQAYGIQMAGAYGPCKNNVITNNTIYDEINRGGIVLWGSQCDHNIVQNNIIKDCMTWATGYWGIESVNDGGYHKIRNNCIYNCSNGDIDSAFDATNTIENNLSQDPNIDSDYRPKPTSPCINAGKTKFSSTYDIIGVLRKQDSHVDIGCYETVIQKFYFKFTASSPNPSSFKIIYVDASKKWWLDGVQYHSGETVSVIPDDDFHYIEIEASQLYDFKIYNLHLDAKVSNISDWNISQDLSLALNQDLVGDIAYLKNLPITNHLELYSTGLFGNTSAFRDYTCAGYVTMEYMGFTGVLSDFSSMNPTVVRIQHNNISGDLADIRHWSSSNYKYLYSCNISSFSENDTLFPNSLEIRLNDNVLDSISIDNIIIAKDNDGLSNGILALENNSPPTSASSAALSNLISKGWIVTHD